MTVSAAQLRRMASAIEGAVDETVPDRIVFSIGGRGFAWTYYGRVAPKTPRVAFMEVIAVSCPLDRKELLIEAAPEIYFDDDHYRNYPAVLVRLKTISAKELKALLQSARDVQAQKPPKRKAPAKKKVAKKKSA
ncbi:MAG: MmcQ/YjbR family DNA-binding protein [Pseudomonadota bacterium]